MPSHKKTGNLHYSILRRYLASEVLCNRIRKRVGLLSYVMFFKLTKESFTVSYYESSMPIAMSSNASRADLARAHVTYVQ